MLEEKAVSSSCDLKNFPSHSTTYLYVACLMVLPCDFLKTFTFLPLMEPANVCKHGKMGISKWLAIVCDVYAYHFSLQTQKWRIP